MSFSRCRISKLRNHHHATQPELLDTQDRKDKPIPRTNSQAQHGQVLRDRAIMRSALRKTNLNPDHRLMIQLKGHGATGQCAPHKHCLGFGFSII